MKLTIKRKLIFLLRTCVALVLVLVGTSFDHLVRRFHEEQAMYTDRLGHPLQRRGGYQPA
ncbi:MAG: hypothetical protein WC012_09020 [Thiohalomonadaceae bacterium]